MKVFVVVLTVFSIAFSVLVIGYAAQTTNWKALAEKNREWALQEQAAREAVDSKCKVIVGQLNKTIESLQSQIAAKNSEIDRLTVQMRNLNNELLSAKGKIESLVSQSNQLTNMNSAINSERKVLRDQLEKLRKDLASVRIDNLRLADENQKLKLQIKLYESEIRLLKEQNVALEQKLVKVRRKLRSVSAEGTEEVGEEAGVSGRIVGKVTRVHNNLASLSVGSAQGVKNGMVFIVYRGDQYLGKLRITKVVANESVGEIIQKRMSVQIQAGDSVTDRFIEE